ncbi:MAG: translation initiation factor IF-2 [Rhodospirillales bacterium]|jgi:translation initiation factor IF-2|nr:translation initiation factor IF-2 [Rhodospirillales bacterium]MDP6646238.1 translation initiation factor IF-2 [Rhodospirillales bacterium]MDP6842049.1 translation initiation factor IF-2 [Rhodospirillales bacterium]
MTDTKEKAPKKTLSLSRPGKLELKKTVEGGQVRQSFSHGRSKVVAVEVRKKRTFEAGSDDSMQEVKEPVEAVALVESVQAEAPDAVAEAAVKAEARAPTPARELTDHERAARAKALQDARRAEEEARKGAELKEIEAAEAEPEVPAEEQEAADQGDARQAEEVARREREAEETARQEKRGREAAEAGMAKLKQHGDSEEEENGDGKRGRRGKTTPRRPTSARRGEPRRRSGRLTINEALDENERVRSLASVKRAREKQKKKDGPIEHVKIVREVTVPEAITVQELANRMAERGVDVVGALMKLGIMSNVTETIDADTAELVVAEFGHKLKRVADSDVEIGLAGEDDAEMELVPRPPVVTVMGHVDHGKTSLLDALRETDVVAGEAGGITQHIGAYQTTLASGEKITFIDTPGHEAFTEMRARGANATDIVVLVVAANDGIMPQTIEAISHAKAAEVPVIIAINKVDLPDANPLRIRTQLLEHEIVLESMGGEVLDVEVSATKKTNLDKLEETILLQAEILDLKSNPSRPAEGVVVEAKIEPGRGPVATVLVQRGTLKTGDIFVAGAEWGRARALVDDRGNSIEEAGPSQPVELTGLNGPPAAGDDLVVVESEARAREIAEFRQNRDRTVRTSISPRGTLEEMFSAIQAGEAKELAIIVKGDVQGSIEAITGMLDKLPQDEVKINVLHSGAGGINESDVTLAEASGGVIIGFNVRANAQARAMAKSENVDIRYYSVIYDVTDDMKKMLVGMMAPEIRETFLGNAEVREVFNVSKVGRVAGCYISEGTVRRGAKVRLLRDDVVIHEGSLSTLKRFKDDVREVNENYECGMSFENYNDLKVGDVIECFDVQEIAPQI